MLSYSGSGTCYWRIKSPNNGRIRVQITSLRYACALSCEQFVEFKYGLSLAATGARMCCSPTVTQFLSDGHYVIIISTASQASQFVIQYRNEGGTTAPQRSPPRPATTVFVGRWSGWGGWSACTEKCGACGVRSRIRSCLSGRCSGSSRETQTCNLNACARGTTVSGGGARGSRRGKRQIDMAGNVVEEEEEKEEHEEESHLGHSATLLMTAIRQKRNANYWCCERYLAKGSVCVHV
ncbi:unnamed protein product, partial [Mesorhabditis spiculigera]